MSVVCKKMWNVSWAKNASNEGGAQAYCLSNLKPGEVCIASHTQKEGRLWANITPSDLLKLIEKNHGIFEVIPRDAKRKVYFDIDGRSGLDLNAVREAIIQKFPGAKLAISGNISVAKASYHITLTNYFFKNQDAQKCLIYWLKTLPEELGFDTKVYTTNRLMKCVKQSKPDGRVQEAKTHTLSLREHLILSNFDSDATDATELEWLKSLVQTFETKQDMSSKLDILTIPEQSLITPEHFTLRGATPYQILQIIPNSKRHTNGSLPYAVQVMIMCWAKQKSISFEDFWNWSRTKDDSVDRFEKYKALWETKVYQYKDRTIIELLKQFYPAIEEPADFTLDMCVPPTQYIRDEKYLAGEDLTRAFAKSGVVYVSLQMGRNKTGGTIDWLMTLPRTTRVLWISTRISYAENVEHRLKSIGFVNYKKLKEDHGKHDRIIISSQSIYKTHGASYDVVVLDEVETIKYDWVSDTTHTTKRGSHLEANWRTYMTILNDAKYTLMLDAIPCNTTLKFYAKDTTPVVLGSHEPLQSRTLYEFCGGRNVKTNCENWKLSIIESLKAGKNLFIFYPYKSEGKSHIGMEQFAKVLTIACDIADSEYRTYHGDTSDVQKRELGNVNQIWSGMRFVITNTAISVGVNFDHTGHFDEIYTNYASFIPPRAVIQNMGRVRENIPINVVFSVPYSSFEFMTPSLVHIAPRYKQLMNGYMMEHYSRGKKSFKQMAQLVGCAFTPSDSTRCEEEFKRMNEIEEMTDCLFRWELIINLNEAQVNLASQHADNQTATHSDKLALSKVYFRLMFEPDTPDDVLKMIWNMKKSAWCRIFEKVDTDPILKAMLGDDLTPSDPTDKTFDFELYQFTEFRDRVNSRVNFIDNKITNQFQNIALKAIFGADIWKPKKDEHNHYTYSVDDTYEIVKDYYLTWRRKPAVCGVPMFIDNADTDEDEDKE